MISEAVQDKLVTVLSRCYAHVAPENAAAPFILHIEEGSPIRTKNGLAGYNYTITVIVVALDPATRESFTAAAISAIESLSGTTSKNTQIDEVVYVSDTPAYDEETDLYGINILFNAISTNR